MPEHGDVDPQGEGVNMSAAKRNANEAQEVGNHVFGRLFLC